MASPLQPHSPLARLLPVAKRSSVPTPAAHHLVSPSPIEPIHPSCPRTPTPQPSPTTTKRPPACPWDAASSTEPVTVITANLRSSHSFSLSLPPPFQRVHRCRSRTLHRSTATLPEATASRKTIYETYCVASCTTHTPPPSLRIPNPGSDKSRSTSRLQDCRAPSILRSLSGPLHCHSKPRSPPAPPRSRLQLGIDYSLLACACIATSPSSKIQIGPAAIRTSLAPLSPGPASDHRRHAPAPSAALSRHQALIEPALRAPGSLKKRSAASTVAPPASSLCPRTDLSTLHHCGKWNILGSRTAVAVA